MPSVFVTDGSQRKAVPIVRSLGRHGIRVDVGSEARIAPSAFSRYCHKHYLYPSPRTSPDEFASWLESHVERTGYDVVMPIDEISQGVIAQNLVKLLAKSRIPIVDWPTFMTAHDKANTLKLAASAGVPCPRTFFPNATADVLAMQDRLEFPVVIKPRQSSGSRGLVVVQRKQDLLAEYERISAHYALPLVQEYLPPGGDTFGVEVLMNRASEPRAVFVHRRLREYPISGGPSTLRESVTYPELADLGIALLREMRWYGVAMVEFKVDPRDHKPKLMEVNPKFWGSIALPIAAGVEFPYLLYKMAMDGDVEPVAGYEAGVMCRWLIPGDLLHFLSNPNRMHLTPSFFQFRAHNLHYDIWAGNDPGPFVATLLSLASQAVRPSVWRKDIFR
jgi:predicted ATP-grasp superfamily ATP-dependent carboligase